MREIFKAQLQEFYKKAWIDYKNEALWDEDITPEPMDGDQFFLMEESAGDPFDALLFKSAREDEDNVYEWNSNNGSWQRMSCEDIPDEIL